MRGRRCSHQHQPRIRKPVRHRPVSTPGPAAGRREPAQGTGASPVAGLARSCPKALAGCQRKRGRSHLPSGIAARYANTRRAFLPPGSKRSRSIRQREHAKCDTGIGGWGRNGRDIAVTTVPWPSPHWWGRKQNQGLGVSQVMDFARKGVGLGFGISPSPAISST